MLSHSLLGRLVDGEQGLARSPVHLADELAAECVDDTGNGRRLAFADEVEVEHALHSLGLQAVHEASRLVVEEHVLSRWAHWPAGCCEAADVVVG